MGVLSAANAEDGRIAREAEDDAVALLPDQQESAAGLLRQAQADAAFQRISSMEDASDMLEVHRAAGELLGATEEEEAGRLPATRSNAAVDVLVPGH